MLNLQGIHNHSILLIRAEVMQIFIGIAWDVDVSPPTALKPQAAGSQRGVVRAEKPAQRGTDQSWFLVLV